MPQQRTLTKASIIEALTDADLRPGRWVRITYDRAGVRSDEVECQVCAVGAALRGGNVFVRDIQKVASGLTRKHDISDDKTWEGLPNLIMENPLAALSAVFESTFPEDPNSPGSSFRPDYSKYVEKARERCLSFVKSPCFPDEITIEWNRPEGYAAYLEIKKDGKEE